jgi:DNA-binding transcriptional MocR family regulator
MPDLDLSGITDEDLAVLRAVITEQPNYLAASRALETAALEYARARETCDGIRLMTAKGVLEERANAYTLALLYVIRKDA